MRQTQTDSTTLVQNDIFTSEKKTPPLKILALPSLTLFYLALIKNIRGNSRQLEQCTSKFKKLIKKQIRVSETIRDEIFSIF